MQRRGVYWYIIGSVTCSTNPDRRVAGRTKLGVLEERTGAGELMDYPATLSNARWICHFQTYSFSANTVLAPPPPHHTAAAATVRESWMDQRNTEPPGESNGVRK